MNKALLLLMLFVSVNGALAVSSYYSDYDLVVDDTSLYACVQPVYDNSTKSFSMKISVDVDSYEELSSRWCLGGVYMNLPYERRLWIRDSVLSNKYLDVALSNFASFDKVFVSGERTNRNNDVLYSENAVNYVLSLTSSPANTANKYLLYDTSRGVDYTKDKSYFYYALGVDDATGMSGFYNTATSSWASEDDFNSYGLGYPPSDLSNPSVLLSSGRVCGGNYLCVTESALDVDLKSDNARAFFAFSDDLDYYYYPYYVKSISYTVVGYSNSSKTNQIYYKKGSVPFSSNDIYFPYLNSRGVSGFRIFDNVFDFASKVSFDGSIATVPDTVGYVEIITDIVWNKNNYYRHESPADNTWSMYNITDNTVYNINGSSYNGVCGGGSVDASVCEDYESKGFKTTLSYYIFVNNGTTSLPVNSDLDNSMANNDFNTTSTNTTTMTPESVTLQDGSGVDWSRDSTESGSLQSQLEYARGAVAIDSKAGFFKALQEVAMTILEIILTIFMLVVLLLSVYVFLIMIPSAYRKLLNELKKLGDMRWR